MTKRNRKTDAELAAEEAKADLALEAIDWVNRLRLKGMSLCPEITLRECRDLAHLLERLALGADK